MIKLPWDPLDVELYARVEQHLNRHGIRQARQHRRPNGDLLSSSGHAVQELLPGKITERPSRGQTINTMAHLAEFDRALADLEPPEALATRDTPWSRVVRTDYLLDRLPGLITDYGPDWLEPAPIESLLVVLRNGATTLAAHRRQLVHGDLGPDNVLYDGDRIVALIDFTPFHDTVLLGLASAIYFFQLHGHPGDRAAIEASIDAYGADRAIAWTALVRESLRRLATPLAVAENGGSFAEGRTRQRYAAAAQLAALLGRG